MSAEMLTYAALGAQLKISPEAARALAKRLRLPRSLSQDGKALVNVEVTEIRHRPRAPSLQAKGATETKIAALQAEIARLEVTAASHRADFEHERERADRLMAEPLRAAAETMAAKEAAARLDGELAALRAIGAGTGQGQAASRIRHLAATLVEADRRACK